MCSLQQCCFMLSLAIPFPLASCPAYDMLLCLNMQFFLSYLPSQVLRSFPSARGAWAVPKNLSLSWVFLCSTGGNVGG